VQRGGAVGAATMPRSSCGDSNVADLGGHYECRPEQQARNGTSAGYRLPGNASVRSEPGHVEQTCFAGGVSTRFPRVTPQRYTTAVSPQMSSR